MALDGLCVPLSNHSSIDCSQMEHESPMESVLDNMKKNALNTAMQGNIPIPTTISIHKGKETLYSSKLIVNLSLVT